jgi:predicted AlkP superfamily pyrophosphatase or phosphodiesterase
MRFSFSGKNVIIPAVALIFFCFVSFAQSPVRNLKPTVILISLDGFRYDYLEKFNPPTLNHLAKNGVRAKWLIPSFPTKTFPNHYTIATGLYPDNHGIIENNMYDAEFDAVFALNRREEVQNPRWWGGEPIWVTAQKQGQIAASFFFPGTETPILGVRPTFWKEYDGSVPNEKRVDTILQWLDLPSDKRPTMLTLYFSDVDDAGHSFGPDAEETKLAVLKVDENLARLYEGLKKRKIEKKVNLIIVSDHGMVAYKMRDAIILDEMFDVNLAERIIWVGEFTQIFPKAGREEEIYQAIKSRLPATANIYRRGEFPERFRFGKNKRIAPLVVVPQEGIIITNKERYRQAMERGMLDRTRGTHGYDNNLPSMRAIFIAHGRNFRKGYVAEPFANVEIYNLMCAILKLKPASNDGNFKLVWNILK